MTLYKTKEAYLNLGQENRSYILTKTRIEEYITPYEEENAVISWECIDRGKEIFTLGLGDIDDEDFKNDILNFLSELLGIPVSELEDIDYLNLRNF